MAFQTALTESIDEAAALILEGKLVAFPTETVYGLGANALDRKAVKAIFEAKERPADNPLIVHIHSTEQIATIAKKTTSVARLLVDAFFPGALTIILDRSEHIPSEVSAGLDSVAIRMPSHPVATALLKACDVPIAAPSANRSGRPSPTTWKDVYTDMKGRISCILKGEQSDVGLESTVVDCRGDTPRILRTGGISVESIQVVHPGARHIATSSESTSPSPGLKYRHYAPKADVHIVHSPEEVLPSPLNAYLGIHPHPIPEKLGLHLTCDSVQAYAYELFHFFRRCDRAGIQHIYCQATETKELGLALMDRIRRAGLK